MTLRLGSYMLGELRARQTGRRVDMAPRTKMGATVTAQVIRGDDGAFNVERDATGVPIMREWKRGRGDTWSWHRKPAKGEAYLTWLNNAMQEFDADGDVSVFFSSGEYPDRRYIPNLDSLQPGERAMPLQPDAMPGAVQYDSERPARRTPTQQPSATSGATGRKIDHIQAVIDDVPDTTPGFLTDNLQPINPDGSIPLRDRVLRPGTEEWQDWLSPNLTDGDLRDPDMPKVVRDAASAPATPGDPPQFRPNRNAPRDEFSGLLDDLANEEARVSPIDVTESRYSDADGAPKSFRPSPRGRGLFPEAEDVFKSGQNLPPDADAPPLYRRRPGRATIAGGVAALGGLGLGVALDQMMRQRQERNQVATDDRTDMAAPEIEAMYRAEADRIFTERLGRPQEQIQQSIDELAESVTGVPASEMPRGTKWWRHPGMTADDRVALTELTGEMRVSREKWRSVPPGVSDADVIQATREESIAQGRENVDREMTARAEERSRRQPRPAPAPDAPLVSEPDPPRVETPEPETPRAETPDRTPMPDEPDTPRRRWRGRGLGGVALGTAGGLGLGYALRDMMAQWQENRADMAPLPAVVAGNKFAEAHKAARNVFDRMIRQGQSEGEARVTASRWVKGNLNVDVEWPEAPGFDAGAVGASAWRHPNDAGFGRSQKWWDNFYRGMDDNPRSNAYRDRKNQEFWERAQEREQEWARRSKEYQDRMRQQDQQRWQEQTGARSAEWDRVRAEYAERMADILNRNQSNPNWFDRNPVLATTGLTAGIVGVPWAGATGVAYGAGRLSDDPDPSPEKMAQVEAFDWPIPQAYRAGRGAGDQGRFNQPRQDMAPVELPEQWPYADVSRPTTDFPLTPADPAQVRAIQRQLLDEAGGNLAKARAAAQKLENQRLKDLEARVKPMRSGNRYGTFRDELVQYRPSISDPVHIATGPFLASAGPQREVLEQLAAESGVSPEKIAQDRQRLQNPRASRNPGPRPRSGQPMGSEISDLVRGGGPYGSEGFSGRFDPDTLRDAWTKQGGEGDIPDEWQRFEIGPRGDDARVAHETTLFNNRVSEWENELDSARRQLPRSDEYIARIQELIPEREQRVLELEAIPRGQRSGIYGGYSNALKRAREELSNSHVAIENAIADRDVALEHIVQTEASDPRIERQVQQQSATRSRLIQEEVARQQGRVPESRIEEPWQVEERGIDTSARQARELEEVRQRGDVRIETVEASTGYRIGKPFHTRVVSGNEIVESRLFATQEEVDAAMKGFQEKYGVTLDAPETARVPDTAPPPEPEVRRNAPENIVDEPEPARYIDEEPPPRAAPEPETPPQRLRRRLRSGSARGNIIAGATVGALGLGAVLATELNRRRTLGSTPEGV